MSQLGAAVAATAVVAAGLGVGAGVRPGGAPVHQAVGVLLTEDASCDEVVQRADRIAAQGNLRVVVPSIALVHVDDNDQVIAATTNTGCAPRPSDDVYRVRPDGVIHLAGPGLADREWRGDFRTRGTLVSQVGGD